MSMAVETLIKEPARARSTAHSDRLFYATIAGAAAMMTLTGFAPTYYLRLFDGGPSATISGGPFTTLYHVHGALFTGWVALFIAQTALISTRRVAIHRKVGVAGGLLAAAMVIVGVFAGIGMARRGGAPPGIDPLSFLAIPLFDMLMFASFVTTALAVRRDKESHKRLMLLAYASLLGAPAARLPGVLPLGPFAFYGIAFLIVVAGVAYDYLSRRRVHNVYLWGGALLFVSVPLRLVISSTSAWHTFAQFLIG
jgi:hypothetical protein